MQILTVQHDICKTTQTERSNDTGTCTVYHPQTDNLRQSGLTINSNIYRSSRFIRASSFFSFPATPFTLGNMTEVCITRDLHWLDMTERVQFRTATTVYRCLHGTAPEYLSELFYSKT